MKAEYSEQSVGALVSEKPHRAEVFERLGIDYCCGGGKSLAESCKEREIPLEKVCEALVSLDNEPNSSDVTERNWAAAPLEELIDHIIEKHHVYLREALPLLEGRMEKVFKVHGEKHPEVVEVHQLFASLKNELTMHMQKEEQILFPWIKQMEASQASPQHACGSVRNPIGAMESEHEFAGSVLKRISELTKGHTPPEGACNTFCALYDGLSRLEKDLHIHIHKENNILFPRAAKLEDSLSIK